MKNLIFALILSLTLFNINLVAQTPGTNRWFVNRDASGSDNGTSWDNAWTSFSNINWNLISSGSTIYISGGSDSLVYDMSLTIPQGKNGVTITKGLSSGHNGKVIFDSDWSKAKAISIDGNGALTQNITIKNITIRDYSTYGIYGDGQNSGGLQHILIDSVRVESHYRAGIFFEGNGNTSNNFDIVVRNCYVNDENTNSSQCDNIYAQYLSDFRVTHCQLIVDNNYSGSSDLHSDNCQTFWVDNVIYDNNIVSQSSATKVLGTQMLFTENGLNNGKHIFYNNTLYRNVPNATDWCIRVKSAGSSNTALVVGNSFIIYGRGIGTVCNLEARNNIMYGVNAPSTGTDLIYSQGTSTQSNNIIYDPQNRFNSESGGTEGNPLFVNTNYPTFDLHIGESSPAINSGYNAQSIIEGFGLEWKDIDGNVRDSSPAAGALELTSGNNTDITPPQVVSASLTNSTTLVINFSESLNSSTAQNTNNYSINNGINVTAASVSASQVTLTTSVHTTGNYVVTVNNVTDPAGNVINSNYKTANYNYTAADITPPQVVSASLTNSTILVINFSEAVNSSSAQNKNHYLINNGIIVSSAVLSGTQVTLTTSAHVSGAYTVTVNNVTDLAGNVVDPQHNSAAYEFQSSSGLLKFPVEQVVASVTPEPTHTGEKTIDGKGFNHGDPDSRWAGDTMPEWLVYDLGSINMLTTTKLSFFKWEEGRTYNYSIQASTDNVNWTAVRTNVVSLPQEWSQETVTPISTRYIKITFISNNLNSWAGLWEAEFWGNNSTDVTPPQVVSAALTSSTKLVINFSETLSSSTAQNKSNYLISNGITVSSAVLSGTQVTLTTSAHSTGAYTVTVNYVTDPAGNIINPLYKTLNYASAIDNVRPYFTRLTVTSSTSITVNFSEKLDPIKAKDRNNYSINNSRTIYSVVLLPDSMSVKLNTSYHSKYKDYTLTISNITDRAGNIISPNPKSVIYRRTNSGATSPIQNPIEGAISNAWDPSYLPEKTIDGEGMINPDSRWMSSSLMPDTLYLDMGNIYTMDSLRISFYQWNSDRLFKYSMLSSIDSLIWEPVVSDIWSDSLEWTNIEFDSTQARFVKLILLESNQNQPAGIWEIELYGPTGVTGINNETEIPNSYILSQNYPNPFNPSTTISYTLPEKSNVSIKIFDLLGAEVMELVNSELEPGAYKVDFNARGLPSGVYFYRLETKSFVETMKMILLK